MKIRLTAENMEYIFAGEELFCYFCYILKSLRCNIHEFDTSSTWMICIFDNLK